MSKSLYAKYVLSPRLAVLLATAVVSVGVVARQPRLVLGIVVDGLRQEILDELRDRFGPDGFNRLLDNGLVIENADYGTPLDVAASTAVVYTGAAPSVNGIASSSTYDPVSKRHTHVLHDDKVLGNYTSQTLSPAGVGVSTLGDEVAIASAGVGYVYSIAPDASRALIMGGHAGSGAVWLDPATGNWASSTYYGDLPTPAANANRLAPLSARLDTMQWVPGQKTAAGASLPDHLTRYPFRHTFGRGMADRYVRYSNSPLINTDIATLAQQYVGALDLGRHDATDMLNVGFTLAPYRYTRTAENRYELYDAYIKLDRDLARLLNAVDNATGAGNNVVFLASAPAASTRRRDDERWRVPGGEFSSRKAASLLNLYLIALHGNGDWVTGFDRGAFYLNNKLAEDRDVNRTGLAREAAEFLVRMSGVSQAVTVDDVLLKDDARARNTVVSQAGDVLVTLTPGWSMVDDLNAPGHKADANDVNILTPATAPFMLMAPGVGAQRLAAPVDARVLAPTVAGTIRIRAPNAAATPPLHVNK